MLIIYGFDDSYKTTMNQSIVNDVIHADLTCHFVYNVQVTIFTSRCVLVPIVKYILQSIDRRPSVYFSFYLGLGEG
jgi:hypothetical protein